MSIKRTECEDATQKLCKDCAVFYGSEAFGWLCSSCYKKSRTAQKEEIQQKVIEEKTSVETPSRKATAEDIEIAQPEPVKQVQKDRKRCFDCRKKVGLLGIQCKCGYVFCNTHRLPQEHNCSFNHQEAGKQKLAKQIVKVYNGKIQQL